MIGQLLQSEAKNYIHNILNICVSNFEQIQNLKVWTVKYSPSPGKRTLHMCVGTWQASHTLLLPRSRSSQHSFCDPGEEIKIWTFLSHCGIWTNLSNQALACNQALVCCIFNKVLIHTGELTENTYRITYIWIIYISCICIWVSGLKIKLKLQASLSGIKVFYYHYC